HRAQRNLVSLAETRLPLMPKEELEQSLALYAETFNTAWQRAFARKLGRASPPQELLTGTFEALSEAETDFTLFFRNLAAVPLERPTLEPLRRAFYDDTPR